MVGLFCFSAYTCFNKEYQIKALFLYNFTQFITWPDKAFQNTESPLIIGILGDDPFGTYLDETVEGEKINGHPLAIRRYNNVKEAEYCHLIFIHKSKGNSIPQIISDLKGKNILTVSDAPDFIYQGGMIRFITVNNKIQFEINPEAIKAEELKVSSKLLSLAKIVIPEK